MSTESNKGILEANLSYELGLLMLVNKDVDRAKYYNKRAEDEFLKMWSNFGSFASVSKHEFLQNL